jgi:hypothetical protein
MKMGGDMIEVDEFVFLGMYISKHRDELDDMRMGVANNAYHTILPVVKL